SHLLPSNLSPYTLLTIIVILQPPTLTLFPYTTLFRSEAPGLIVTVYNWSRPRDISHYERFRPYHEAIYQHVEATSVTPFAPRAQDRKSTRLNSSHGSISYAVFCLKKKKKHTTNTSKHT